MRYFLAILISTTIVTASSAQKIVPKYTFNTEIGLPVGLINAPFRDMMNGLACASLYGQYSFPFHLNIGLGARYTLFTVNEFSKANRNGQMHTAAAFLKVGWDKFHTDRFATDFGVKVGYSMNFSNTFVFIDEVKQPPYTYQVNSIIVEPTLGLILSANENNSYRLNIGYCIQGHGFGPETIGLDSNEGYDSAVFNKLTQYLVVGFGYTFYFKDKSN